MVTKNIKRFLTYPYHAINTLGNDIAGDSGTNSAAAWMSLFGNGPQFTKSIVRTDGNQAWGKYFDVGFGNTPATSDDVKLADGNLNIVIGSTTVLAGQMKLDKVSESQNTKVDGQIDNYTVTLINNTNETLTVKEIGIYAQNGLVSSSAPRHCLILRKVLSTPIVFAPGDQYAITYSLSLNI